MIASQLGYSKPRKKKVRGFQIRGGKTGIPSVPLGRKMELTLS